MHVYMCACVRVRSLVKSTHQMLQHSSIIAISLQVVGVEYMCIYIYTCHVYMYMYTCACVKSLSMSIYSIIISSHTHTCTYL